MSFQKIAESNFQKLQQNSYPGRGLIVGKSDDSTWQIIYWIMGRSTNSRNRRFIVDGTTMRTEPVDIKLLSDPSLIIYDAMLDLPGIYLASNGDQTRTIYESIQKGSSFEDALMTRDREPDAPNYTPRISCILDTRTSVPSVTLSILKASLLNSEFSDRYFFKPSYSISGYGYGLTTYASDGNPLPSFSGDPILLPCSGTATDLIDHYWNALNKENLVALAVKTISLSKKISTILVKNAHE
jgi:hypothetical protein